MIGARTDADESRGVTKAIRRENAYAEAGADMIAIAPRWSRETGKREETPQALRRISDEVKAVAEMLACLKRDWSTKACNHRMATRKD